MRDAHDPAPRAGRLTSMWCLWLGPVFAAASGCGDVKAMMSPDAAAPPVDAPVDGPVNRCAPTQCLLADEFAGPDVDKSLWGVVVGGGATVTQKNGVLTLHLPQGPEAFADVYSLVGFAVGTTFMASVTFTPGQF